MAAVPAAAVYIMVAASVAASAAAAYSSYEQGRQQKKMAEYNASIAEQQAEQAKQAAALKAEDYEKEAQRRLSSMRAGYAAAGFETSEGTPLLVMMDSAREAEKQKIRIKYGGDVSAWGFMSEADLQNMIGSNAQTQGNLGAGASLLSGVSNAASMYYKYQAVINENQTHNRG